MIARNFEYSTPSTLAEALALLADGEAKALSGGMSLIPLMKLRLASPDLVVDLSGVPGLNGIVETADGIEIGAMTTHHDVESSALLRSKCPLLAETAAAIGDVQIRNRGTIGGAVAHADPSADYPAALQALEARVKIAGVAGERVVSAADFFVDTFTTALEPGELVTGVIVPAEAEGTGVNYTKMLQPASGFAIVGIAVRVRKDGSLARIGVTGLGAKSYRAEAAEAKLAAGDVDGAAALVADGVEANADIHASAAYRSQMARVYGARAMRAALNRAA